MPDYSIEVVESAPFSQNCYILRREGDANALVVDPGFETAPVLRFLEREGLTPAIILNTHGHVDHIAGNAAMKRAFPDAPLVIGQGDEPMLSDPDLNLSTPFGLPVTSPPADRTVVEGDRVEAAGFSFLVREVPGHSPGSVVYIAEEFDPPIVLGGDVLFAGSVGRTDFPDGDFALLRSGIRSKLFTLPESTLVYPGHGPATTIGAERRSNPFVGEQAGPFFA